MADLVSLAMALKAGKSVALPERFSQTSNKETLETFASGHGWTRSSPTGSTIEADTTNYRTGSQAIKLNAVTTSSLVCWIDETYTDTMDLSEKTIEMDVYVPDYTKISSIDLLLSTATGFSNFFVCQILGNELRNGWNRVFFLPRTSSKLGSSPPTVDNLNATKSWRLKIVATTGNDASMTVDCIRLVKNPLAKGKVIITMDDGWSTQWDAKTIMDKYGLRGVAYIITGDYTKTPITANRLTLDQLKTLDALGWDICSHTVTHRTLPSLSASEMDAELRDSKKWLIENGFERGSHHIATPGGQFNPTALAAIAKYYTTHRTILEGEEAFPPANPIKIRAHQMFNYVTESEIKAWIDSCVANKTLLVLSSHRFVPTTTADIEMTTTLFDAICAYIKSKIDAGTLDNVTWSELVQLN